MRDARRRRPHVPPSRSRFAPGGWVLALFVGSACSPSNELGGSIDVSFSLEFDRVALRKQDEFLLVEYLKEAQAGTEKVCKLIVNNEILQIVEGEKYEGTAFLEGVEVRRVALTGGDFPPVEEGELELDPFEFVEDGEVAGEFDVIFDNGRSLRGQFSGRLEEVQKP